MTRVICVALLVLATVASGTDSDEADFVPKFFGGRRNEGEQAGIAPPKPRQKTRSGLAGSQQLLNFTQKLDHFNSTCRRSWTQRYLMDDQYFKANRSRPIVFIRIGGESTIRDSDLSSGPMVLLAKRHGALLLELEHRYYGESRPTVIIPTSHWNRTPQSNVFCGIRVLSINRDTKRANLRLLSSKQALADLNMFINYSRKEYFSAHLTEPRIVLYGCSYAGSLAAWHRMFFPNITLGSVAQCAPMFPKADLKDYFPRVTAVTAMYDEECHLKILDIFTQWIYEALLFDKTTHRNITAEILNLCPPTEFDFDNPHAIDSLYYDLVSELMQAVQYNKMTDGSKSSIGRLCTTLKSARNSGLNSTYEYGEWLKQQDTTCLAHDGKNIVTRNATWDAQYVESGTRQWLYQMCNESGYFTTIALDTSNSASGKSTLKEYSDLAFFEKICTSSFNVTNMQTRVNKTREHYASLNSLNKLSNVVFLNGDADPWRGVGINTNYTKPTVMVINVQNMSHCEEPSDLNDSSSDISTAWKNIFALVTLWLADA